MSILVEDKLAPLNSAESAVVYLPSPNGDLLKRVKFSGYLRGLSHSGGPYNVGRSADRSREPATADRSVATFVLDEYLNALRIADCREYGQEIYDLHAAALEHLTTVSLGTAPDSNHGQW